MKLLHTQAVPLRAGLTQAMLDRYPRRPVRQQHLFVLRSLRPRQQAIVLVVVLIAGRFGLGAAEVFGEDAHKDLRVDVRENQRVTVAGRAPSLKTVVEDLCYRAGVDLVFYDADDRAFGGSYTDLSFPDLLGRLLHNESFLLEKSVDRSTGTETVTTLRVLGDPAVAAARRARGGRRHRPWQVPPVLLDAAFGADDSADAERDAALATMASRISNDPSQLQGFLATKSQLIAQTLRRYKGVEGALAHLKGQYPDPRIGRKIDEIIAALANPAPPPSKGPLIP